MNTTTSTTSESNPRLQYRYRVNGWRTGLLPSPQVFCETLEQATLAAVRMQAKLLALDAHMANLGPVHIDVDTLSLSDIAPQTPRVQA